MKVWKMIEEEVYSTLCEQIFRDSIGIAFIQLVNNVQHLNLTIIDEIHRDLKKIPVSIY